MGKSEQDDAEITDEELWSLWEMGILSWMLWPQQMPIYNGIRGLSDKVTLSVILCARQFGKTFLGVIMAIEDCLRNENKSVLIVGPTIKQCRAIITPKIREICRTAPPGLVRPSKSEGKWYIGSSDLILGGFDQKRSSDRGKTLQTIYIEEVVDSNPDEYLESTRSDLSPALTHSKGGKMIYLTSLPKFPDHPFITHTIPDARMSGAFHSYTIDDNKMLSQEQYDRCVKNSGGVDSIEFRREFLNEIVRDPTVVVIPIFDPKTHVGEITEPDTAFWQLTADWGGVRDLTCLSVHYYAWNLDLDVFVDELVYDVNTPTPRIVEGIRSLLRRWDLRDEHGQRSYKQFVVDAHGQTRIDLNDSGFQIVYPDKKDWVGNVRHMGSRFASNKVLIHPRCKFLIENCSSGTFNKQKSDFERTNALGHCDGLANIMYALKSRVTDPPFKQVQNIRYQSQMTPIQKPNHNLQQISDAISGYRRKNGKAVRF
jgi:Terminase large subunit, T4likevirus-type, N-terminal